MARVVAITTSKQVKNKSMRQSQGKMYYLYGFQVGQGYYIQNGQAQQEGT
jgi:hypothetical protein